MLVYQSPSYTSSGYRPKAANQNLVTKFPLRRVRKQKNIVAISESSVDGHILLIRHRSLSPRRKITPKAVIRKTGARIEATRYIANDNFC